MRRDEWVFVCMITNLMMEEIYFVIFHSDCLRALSEPTTYKLQPP